MSITTIAILKSAATLSALAVAADPLLFDAKSLHKLAIQLATLASAE